MKAWCILIPMDALQISGKWYISSRRAAKEHGYHVDYIGQLIRTGKVKGQKVGRSWYVLADSLTDYLEKEGSAPAVPSKKAAQKEAPKERSKKIPSPKKEEKKEEEVLEEAAEVLEEQLSELSSSDAQPEEESHPTPEAVELEPIRPAAKERVKKEDHQLLTYLRDDDPIIPAVPPTPIVPHMADTEGLSAEESEEREEGTRIPIRAAVKRFNAVLPMARTARSATAPASAAVYALPATPRERRPRASRPRRWLPLALIGAVSFAATIALSSALTTTLSSL